jgi:hypothetical protein
MAPINSLKDRRPSADAAPSIAIALPIYEVSLDAIAFFEALACRRLNRGIPDCLRPPSRRPKRMA